MDNDFVGVDVSKNALDVATYTTNKSWHFPNSGAGINQPTQTLSDLTPAQVVLEATGGYETPLAIALHKAAITCAVVNPRKVRDFAKATKKLAKTDTIDARVLAHFAAVIRPEPRPLSDEPTRELEAG